MCWLGRVGSLPTVLGRWKGMRSLGYPSFLAQGSFCPFHGLFWNNKVQLSEERIFILYTLWLKMRLLIQIWSLYIVSWEPPKDPTETTQCNGQSTRQASWVWTFLGRKGMLPGAFVSHTREIRLVLGPAMVEKQSESTFQASDFKRVISSPQIMNINYQVLQE